ncbi:uncharacterized protein PGTG_19388 [Puccinia graminis f. sp. tritici CRL 75-36-700-3]|uniref:Uncharacterized protein n=1 Tax=Puccinia graminis f. sp. tritici (strain CRL 75-36-700-3 / race SCCL) TaxID=418459 RepID=E3LAA1_PUCGT|nr:uncharacterized protein PGTG_19388 [Puccinia graminis f. sp. tritici CRL 75-36-700-3]EFP93476.1 hypothetical protein PGTG_19388 [Puccinia graminis f. sp. tritici CRL 75-36-700-3]
MENQTRSGSAGKLWQGETQSPKMRDEDGRETTGPYEEDEDKDNNTHNRESSPAQETKMVSGGLKVGLVTVLVFKASTQMIGNQALSRLERLTIIKSQNKSISTELYRFGQAQSYKL